MHPEVLSLLMAHAVSASFGITPDPNVCSGPRVPNVHYRVWVGEVCPPMQDLISLLAAALLLKPERLQYMATHAWWDSSCYDNTFVSQCHNAFGVEHHLVDLRNASSPFMAATSHFFLHAKMAQSQCTHSEHRCFRREHVSDFIRLFVVNAEGGYYLDADSFVVDTRLYEAFAACPFAMFSSVTESPYHRHMNNGAFLGAPRNMFGAAWWRYFAEWDGSLWSDHSCGWPGRRSNAHPEEVHVAPTMLVPPPFVASGDDISALAAGAARRAKRKSPRLRSYAAIDIDGAARAGAMLIHLTNWKVRPHNVTQAVLLGVLDRAIHRSGGIASLDAPRRRCLNALWGHLVASTRSILHRR